MKSSLPEIISDGKEIDHHEYLLDDVDTNQLFDYLDEITNQHQNVQIKARENGPKVNHNIKSPLAPALNSLVTESVNQLETLAISEIKEKIKKEQLTQIKIPSSITSIGKFAISECTSLTQITISSSVTSIGNNAFSQCSSLTQITIPLSMVSIGNYTFSDCSSLAKITIPSSVASIGNYALSHGTSLTLITIPSSVTSIGDFAFSCCSLLTRITVPSSVASIGNDAFSGCTKLHPTYKNELMQRFAKLKFS